MPIELGVWKINGAVERIHFSSIETERKLKDVITHDISIIDPSLIIIGRQINTAFGKYIDILAMNSEGNLILKMEITNTWPEIGSLIPINWRLSHPA